MKYVFLDIDGVFNTEDYLKKVKSTLENYPKCMFDPQLVSNFNEIIDKTNAKIILSSSWRIGMSDQQVIELFSTVGIKGAFECSTPDLSFYYKGKLLYSPRGAEIQYVIDNLQIDDKDYVIIDDCNDMLLTQKDNFFCTSEGLTKEIVDKIINFLNMELKEHTNPYDRLMTEIIELGTRIEKLAKFRQTESFKALEESHKLLLNIQFPVMEAYFEVLLQRQKLFKKEMSMYTSTV